jgi:hypothetical protein
MNDLDLKSPSNHSEMVLLLGLHQFSFVAYFFHFFP